MWFIMTAGIGITIRGSGADAVLRRRGRTGIPVPVIITRTTTDIVRRRHRRAADTAELIRYPVSTRFRTGVSRFGAGFSWKQRKERKRTG